MIGRVPYHLRRLVVSVEDSPVATVGLNQLWVPSTVSKYCTLMTKLLIAMVRSRDSSPTDDKPFINVLGQLHSDLTDALDRLISYIRGRQDADMDNEDLIHIHTVLLHICRPPMCPVVPHGLQIRCPIMRFLIVNSSKSNPSSTSFAFEHVRHVTGPIAILEYWWRCTILMSLCVQCGSLITPPSLGARLMSGSPAFVITPRTHRSTDCRRPCALLARCWAMARTSPD
jgi:hypothetical protein